MANEQSFEDTPEGRGLNVVDIMGDTFEVIGGLIEHLKQVANTVLGLDTSKVQVKDLHGVTSVGKGLGWAGDITDAKREMGSECNSNDVRG
jgi:hypothetical protein